MQNAPETLLEAIRYFADLDVSTQFLAELRWPDGPVCPVCESKESSYLSTRRTWKCKGCKKQYSVKLGTIFEDSPLGLDKWLPALWMLANCKNGVSSYELARALGVTQKTGWFMLHRIRLAMQTGTFKKLSGQVEVDETYIGGKARNMHEGKRKARGTGMVGKAVVMGLLERHGEVRAVVIQDNRAKSLKPLVRSHVEPGSDLFTDALQSYVGLHADYAHQVIDHAESYAKGAVHTNGLENFWSLLKRSIKGTYVAVEPFHLFRYLDEQARRYNDRKKTDGERFVRVLKGIIGRRVTYQELIGADVEPARP
jgi:transposase-like protein